MILLQPPFAELPAYRPIKFLLVFTSTLAAPFENAVVTIYKDAVAIGPPIRFKSSSNAPGVGPGTQDYFFEVDIQKYCQDLLAPNTSLPSIFENAATNPAVNVAIDNDDFYGLFRIEITYEFINSTTGLLTPFPLVDVSNDFSIYTASRTQFEQMDLEDYIGTLLGVDTKFLTKSATEVDICQTDNFMLSFINPLISGFQVRFYDSAGLLLDFGVATSGATVSERTLNVGLDELAKCTWVLGFPVLPNPLIASYQVSFGYVVALAYTRQTEIFTFNLIKCCPLRELRLHWMNLLGGSDSYTFSSTKDLKMATTAEEGEKALSWVIGSTTPNDKSDIGSMKLKSEAKKSYELNTKILTNTEASWLSELLFSPKVYAELDNTLIPVIVQPTTQSISRHKGKIRMPIVVTLVNALIIPRI